jgi:hypothetical protein
MKTVRKTLLLVVALISIISCNKQDYTKDLAGTWQAYNHADNNSKFVNEDGPVSIVTEEYFGKEEYAINKDGTMSFIEWDGKITDWKVKFTNKGKYLKLTQIRETNGSHMETVRMYRRYYGY